ncbi:hypothetical protein GCM10009850_120910 [Nonomuraea monospora]|uniref:Uncharacterized protein n=1 Tax=Nonomuraea monospora TaxID=568818 RepID=A0ABP5PYM2_9ACTN
MEPLLRWGASIVNVGSVAALTAHHAVAYTASEWFLLSDEASYVHGAEIAVDGGPAPQ